MPRPTFNGPNRLAKIRKSRGLTQQALAEAAGLHISQVRRYKTGSAQPTLEGLIKLARSLHVSLDELVFEDHERGPNSSKMQLLFEAVERLNKEEQQVIQELLEGMIIKYKTRRWTGTAGGGTQAAGNG
ncbi:MAG TPA: helix-turn-helix transcriptional regulator [Gammaproteobacteria bacterium]